MAKKGSSPGLAKKIEAATREATPDKVVHRWDLRPDIWGKDGK